MTATATEPRRLTAAEKEEIRNSPCGRCGEAPPYACGSRSHAHRIVPGHKGGEYVIGNVEPRCPPCHRAEHPEIPVAGAIEAALRSQTPEEREANGREGARILWEGLEGKEREEFVRRRTDRIIEVRGAGHFRRAAKRGGWARHSLPAERLEEVNARISRGILNNEQDRERRRRQMREVGRLPKDPAVCSRAGSKGAHERWHARRNQVNPNCPHCRANNSGGQA